MLRGGIVRRPSGPHAYDNVDVFDEIICMKVGVTLKFGSQEIGVHEITPRCASWSWSRSL